MGMTAKYLMISALELHEVLAGGEKVVDAIWRKTSAESCCWFLGSFSEENQLIEAKQRGFHLWVDLEKHYREMHWLLTGEKFPSTTDDLPIVNNLLSLAMYASDTVVDTEDFGYGPVRYLTPASVKQIADVLAQTTCSLLAEKHELAVAEDDYIAMEFNAFKEFYIRASKADDAILQIFV